MRIQKLVLQNFMSHQETELDLSNVSACSIVGHNGAGKSAIFEAIMWALFGHARIPNEDLIRSSEEKMGVTLQFEMDRREYLIHRTCKNGIVKVRATVDEEDLGQGAEAIKQRLIQLFGISRELLMESVIITQGRLSSFLTAYSSQRRDYIIAALGLDKYTKAGENAKILLKDAETEFYSHENSFVLIKKDVDALPSYKEIGQKSVEAAKQLADAQVHVKELVGKRDVLIAQDKEARIVLANFTDEAAKIQNRMTTTTADFNKKIQETKAIIDNAKQQIANLGTLQESLKSLEIEFQQATQLSERIKELNADIQRYTPEIGLRQSRLDIAAAASDTCPICRSQLVPQQWEGVIGQMKAELVALIDQKTKAAQEVVSSTALVKTSPQRLSGTIDSKKELITRIQTLKETQPNYERNAQILEEQLESVLNDLVQQLQKAEKNIDAAKAKINIELDDIERDLGAWEFAEEQYRGVLEDCNGQKKSRETLERSMAQAKDKLEFYRNNLPEIQFVSSALSPNGIPLMIVDHYLPLIELKAQAILRSISDGRMKLKLDIVDSGRKGVEIFSGTDQLRPIKSLSGGEQTRVGLSIRLALSQILFEMSQCHFDVLFIDEPEYLDQDGISQFIHSINALRSLYEQIFVISHLEEMKSSFPSIISVTKHDDISSARIEG